MRNYLFHKYNRSSIKGDENFFLLFIIFYILKYNRSSIKGDENLLATNNLWDLPGKYNRSSIKGDENTYRI